MKPPVITLIAISVLLSSCGSRLQTYEQITSRIKSDPVPLVSYMGSDENYHYIFYNPYAGPMFFPVLVSVFDPVGSLKRTTKDFRLDRAKVEVSDLIEYNPEGRGRVYYLGISQDDKERFFRDFRSIQSPTTNPKAGHTTRQINRLPGPHF